MKEAAARAYIGAPAWGYRAWRISARSTGHFNAGALSRARRCPTPHAPRSISRLTDSRPDVDAHRSSWERGRPARMDDQSGLRPVAGGTPALPGCANPGNPASGSRKPGGGEFFVVLSKTSRVRVYRAIITGTSYPIRGLLAFGTNLLVSHAGAAAGRRTLETRDFHAHADIRACRIDYFTRTWG